MFEMEDNPNKGSNKPIMSHRSSTERGCSERRAPRRRVSAVADRFVLERQLNTSVDRLLGACALLCCRSDSLAASQNILLNLAPTSGSVAAAGPPLHGMGATLPFASSGVHHHQNLQTSAYVPQQSLAPAFNTSPRFSGSANLQIQRSSGCWSTSNPNPPVKLGSQNALDEAAAAAAAGGSVDLESSKTQAIHFPQPVSTSADINGETNTANTSPSPVGSVAPHAPTPMGSRGTIYGGIFTSAQGGNLPTRSPSLQQQQSTAFVEPPATTVLSSHLVQQQQHQQLLTPGSAVSWKESGSGGSPNDAIDATDLSALPPLQQRKSTLSSSMHRDKSNAAYYGNNPASSSNVTTTQGGSSCSTLCHIYNTSVSVSGGACVAQVLGDATRWMPIRVWLGRDLSTNEAVVVWLQRVPPGFKGAIHHMGTVLQLLYEDPNRRFVPGIPRCLHFAAGSDGNKGYDALVVPALGPTLMSLVHYCGGTLSYKSVLLLGIQLLQLLMHIFKKHVVLNDISPHTLRFGASAVDSHIAYMTSFGFTSINGGAVGMPAGFAPIGTVQTTSSSIQRFGTSAASSLNLPAGAPQGMQSFSEASFPTTTSHTVTAAAPFAGAGGVSCSGLGDNMLLETSARSIRSSMAGEPSLTAALDFAQVARSNNLYFCSARYHLGMHVTLADDVESVAFTLAYCLLGSLPWKSLVDDHTQSLFGADIVVDEGAPSKLTASRQLYRAKEQFVLHSHRHGLPVPLQRLLSSVQVFNNPVNSSGNASTTSTSTTVEASREAMRSTLVGLLNTFRRHLKAEGWEEDHRFDWCTF